MNLFFNFNKVSFKDTIILFIDCILFSLVVYFLISDILIKFFSLIDNFHYYNSLTEIIFNTVGNNENANIHTPSDTVIHNDSGWSSSIRQIFIYGSGALRLHLLRGGTPLTRTFVLGSTIAADAASKGLVNSIKDPGYVENHINSWRRIIGANKSSVELLVDKDTETLEKVSSIPETTSKFISNGLDNWSDTLLNKVMEVLKPILEPVSVDYSNEVLATQIYGISIILFVLSIFIIILLIAFILNILILVYSDKLMNLFKNKYIRWYIKFNKQIIGIEICFLGVSLLYFMYILSYGIHFIATHPITFQ